MTLQQIIKQTETLSQQDFLNYIYKLQEVAHKRYSLNIFLHKIVKNQNVLQESDKNTLSNKKTDIDDIYNSIIVKQFLSGYSEEDNVYNTL